MNKEMYEKEVAKEDVLLKFPTNVRGQDLTVLIAADSETASFYAYDEDCGCIVSYSTFVRCRVNEGYAIKTYSENSEWVQPILNELVKNKLVEFIGIIPMNWVVMPVVKFLPAFIERAEATAEFITKNGGWVNG